MDPLSDYTALSPRENEPLLGDRRGDSEDVSTEQCSADPNAFAGLRRPFTVVMPQRSAATSGSRGGLRLALDLGASVSQLSQMGANSQPASQFQEVFLDDTQHDDSAITTVSEANKERSDEEASAEVEEKRVEEVQIGHRLRGASKGSGGGFLSVLEQQHWAKPSTNGGRFTANEKDEAGSDSDAMEVDDRDASRFNEEREEDDAQMQSPVEEADEEPVVRSGGFILDGEEAPDPETTPVCKDDAGNEEAVDPEATPVREDEVEDEEAEDLEATPVREDDVEDGARDCEAASDVDDQESMGSTQVLEEDLEADQDLGDDDDDYAIEPCTEAFPETIDQDAALEEDQRNAEREPTILATPEDQPISTLAAGVSSNGSSRSPGSGNRFLKRKQKARDTLRQDERAFVDTEDQTLTELAERIRRERAQTERGATALAPPLPPTTKSVWSSQDESQEDLPPTQPSKTAPGALKKRGKVEASTVQLSDSQERSYEFVDPSCQCGETVCECTGVATSPAKPAARPSSAIRNLEFAFAIPDSQDSESQQLDSFPDLGALALKTLQASRLVEKPPTSQVELATNNSPSKRKHEAATADDATPKKARPAQASSPTSALNTPMANRKRGRTFLSPDAGTGPAKEKRSMEVTPKKSSRSAKPPIAPSAVAGSSTPSVRTRARILSPIPNESSRAYTSRTKSLFKGRFEFCLTGFTGEGQTNLAKLIEDYGGRVWERHQDILQKKPNNKAVVIATSVSWRKLKFMYAVACGIPVVHPEWIHACIKKREIVPLQGYCVPSGCSVTTGKFECLPVKELDIFRGLKFGIPLDVQPTNLEKTRSMSELTTFILRACGADFVQEDLLASREQTVDIVLADEFTKVCESHARKHQAAVKTFAWVTECMILQRFLDPKEVGFTPQQPKSADSKARGEMAVMAASAEIGDSDQTTLKLHTGELLLVDLSAEGKIDHFLLFDVCEILSIHVGQASSAESSKRKPAAGSPQSIRLHVGVLERRPNSPALSQRHTRVIDLTPDKVKRRVVAVSKADFDAMLYRDESIFYYEEE